MAPFSYMNGAANLIQEKGKLMLKRMLTKRLPVLPILFVAALVAVLSSVLPAFAGGYPGPAINVYKDEAGHYVVNVSGDNTVVMINGKEVGRTTTAVTASPFTADGGTCTPAGNVTRCTGTKSVTFNVGGVLDTWIGFEPIVSTTSCAVLARQGQSLQLRCEPGTKLGLDAFSWHN